MSFAGAGFPVPGGAAPAQPQGGFVLNIPADPSWEPFETTDTLDNDGYFMAKIRSEKPRNDQSKKSGVFFTFDLLDDDVKGKSLSKFMPDSNSTAKDSWFVWRGLIRSISSLDHARGAMQYVPGMFTNYVVYFRTAAYTDDGATRTGVDAYVSKDEYEQAKAAGRHRWPAKVKGGGGPSAVGALPPGLPAAFPGLGGPGLPGGPMAPTGTAVPQPMTAAPMSGLPAPAALPPPTAPVAPPTAFSFAPPPGAGQPPPSNGAVPQPTSPFPGFPPPPHA